MSMFKKTIYVPEVSLNPPEMVCIPDVSTPREHCKLIRRSVETKESRFMLRVLRALPVTRLADYFYVYYLCSCQYC